MCHNATEKVDTARFFDPVINLHPQETEDRGCRKVSNPFYVAGHVERWPRKISFIKTV